MISKVYASQILNSLTGTQTNETKNYLTIPSTVYLGLCASEPDATSGSLNGAGEPTSVKSYERKLVSGTSSTTYFEVSNKTGIIKNIEEIQLKTARQDYPVKMNYWFLSTSNDKTKTDFMSAFMWGEIRDVLFDTTTVSLTAINNVSGLYSTTILCEEPLDLTEEKTYVVKWDDKEYRVVATLDSDATTILLGNTEIINDDGEIPFLITYSKNTSDYSLTITSRSEKTSLDIAIYGIGIEVKNNTVPTFYEEQLEISIDIT